MKKLLIPVLVCAMLSLVNCGKVKDALTVDIKVDDVKFNFPVAVDNVTKAMRAGEMMPFSETFTVNLSDLGSSDVMKNADKISNVAVNNAQLKVTFEPQGNYTVKNLKVSVVGVGALELPSYTIGGALTPPSNLNKFIGDFIMKLIRDKSFTVTVEGESDAPAGILNISCQSNLVFTAKLLD
jgi:hypothetical protein